jgi:Fe2+ transport system protein FeoA
MVLAPRRSSQERKSSAEDLKGTLSEGVKLSQYRKGQKGIVLKISGHSDYRHRMMEMGFVKGAEVEVVKYAPLSDPIELVVKGYHISLRRSEAADILMSEPVNAA